MGKLEEADHIAISTDTWDADSNKKDTEHSLLSVTGKSNKIVQRKNNFNLAHFIDKDMAPCFCVLAARSIRSGSHTAPILAKLLKEIFKEFKIDEKIDVILRDGAMESTNLSGFQSVWCTAHILNLVLLF